SDHALNQWVVDGEIGNVIRLEQRVLIGHRCLDVHDPTDTETGGLILVIVEYVRLVQNRIAGDPRNRELGQIPRRLPLARTCGGSGDNSSNPSLPPGAPAPTRADNPGHDQLTFSRSRGRRQSSRALASW